MEALLWVYRQVHNDSPVRYYADPRFYHQSMDSACFEDFSRSFVQLPKNIFLQVTGYIPAGDVQSLLDGRREVIEWHGSLYRVAFTFSLDLSQWVHQLDDDSRTATSSDNQDILSADDVKKIRHFLEHDGNELSSLVIRKKVQWPGWEDLATNIKQKIKQEGSKAAYQFGANSEKTWRSTRTLSGRTSCTATQQRWQSQEKTFGLWWRVALEKQASLARFLVAVPEALVDGGGHRPKEGPVSPQLQLRWRAAAPRGQKLMATEVSLGTSTWCSEQHAPG
eukprot:SRR837773.14937.p1 GENE.SRR837773.14937~~SRR837773.14937.p1  ORF type:complete len:298 (+),score=31.72 SRR837773.14937:59-895(+)